MLRWLIRCIYWQEEQGAVGSGAALESACTGATSAASELERALVAAARDQARDLTPLADEAKRLATDLAHIGTFDSYKSVCPLFDTAKLLFPLYIFLLSINESE